MSRVSVLLIIFIAAFTSCEKDNSSVFDLYSIPYSLEQLDRMVLNKDRVAELTKELFPFKRELAAAVASRGNVLKDLELMAATLIVRDFEESDILWTVQPSEEIEERGSKAYKWTGGKKQFSFSCFCYTYPCLQYTSFTGICKGYSKSGYYRKCSAIDCNIPPACQ